MERVIEKGTQNLRCPSLRVESSLSLLSRESYVYEIRLFESSRRESSRRESSVVSLLRSIAEKNDCSRNAGAGER
jgi:hypothetical protein